MKNQKIKRVLPHPRRIRSLGDLPIWLPEYVRARGWRPPPFSLGLFREAIRYGYLDWPRRIARWVAGNDVLDIGCGRGLHFVGFLFAGATSYTGVDPSLQLDEATIKDFRGVHGKFVKTSHTARQIAASHPRVRFISSELGAIPAEQKFDLVVMHNVTEHLMRIGEDFARIHDLLRPGGILIYQHPNYYAWSGHHMKPRNLDELDETDPEQKKYFDWAHAAERADWPDKIRLFQNRIRLGDLHALTSRYFRIECWTEWLSRTPEGGARLTDEIRARHPALTEQDFLTKHVICVAQKRVVVPRQSPRAV